MLAEAPEGPLHGVPVAIKDQFALPWRAPRDGAYKTPSGIGTGESALFRRLRDAGAVIVAVTNMHEFGLGSTGHISIYGPCGNPWDAVALRRRLVRRISLRRRGATRGRSGRHRRRWLDPLPVRLLRRHRPQADLGPASDRRLHPRAAFGHGTAARSAATPPTRDCSARRCWPRRSKRGSAKGLRIGVPRGTALERPRPRRRARLHRRARRAARRRRRDQSSCRSRDSSTP